MVSKVLLGSIENLTTIPELRESHGFVASMHHTSGPNHLPVRGNDRSSVVAQA